LKLAAPRGPPVPRLPRRDPRCTARGASPRSDGAGRPIEGLELGVRLQLDRPFVNTSFDATNFRRMDCGGRAHRSGRSRRRQPRPHAALPRSHAKPLRILIDGSPGRAAPRVLPDGTSGGPSRRWRSHRRNADSPRAVPRLAARVPTRAASRAAWPRRLVQHLVGLDVDSPGATANSHGAFVSNASVPPPREKSQTVSRTRIRGSPIPAISSRVSSPTLPVHDDLVTKVQNRPNRRHDRVVERHCVPDDGEPGDHVRCGTACRAAGVQPPRRTASRGSALHDPSLGEHDDQVGCLTVASRCAITNVVRAP